MRRGTLTSRAHRDPTDLSGAVVAAAKAAVLVRVPRILHVVAHALPYVPTFSALAIRGQMPGLPHSRVLSVARAAYSVPLFLWLHCVHGYLMDVAAWFQHTLARHIAWVHALDEHVARVEVTPRVPQSRHLVIYR